MAIMKPPRQNAREIEVSDELTRYIAREMSMKPISTHSRSCINFLLQLQHRIGADGVSRNTAVRDAYGEHRA